MTAALAARTGAPLLAAIGATIGVIAASVPAAVMGPALARQVPLRAVRIGLSIVILVIGAWIALAALLLI